MPCSGPRSLPCARSRSRSSASRSALRIDRGDRVELLVVERDAHQVLLNQLARGDASARHGLLHLGDAGLDDVEFGMRRATQQRQKQGREHSFYHIALPATSQS